MSTTEESDDPASGQSQQSRPRLVSNQSNSLPSTPRQLARDGPFDAQQSSLGAQTRAHSPRSTSSESNRRRFNYNPSAQGCRFMSTQVSRRRMPYSDEAGGAAILPKPKQEPKKRLEQGQEAKLTEDLYALYNALLPSRDNRARREMLLKNLREFIAEEWPDKDFKVHVFGSSGNLLYNDKSDVDICVIMKDLTTCALAELLHRRGMLDVKCVHAKIRIVKMQHPELDLKCDLNVNNELALTNTQMVKAYMQLDPRVRPLAMIVKFWTRRRIINEASGGTLSSYTWTLLLINFLQTRKPPVLPRLDTVNGDGRRRENFYKDLETFKDFGVANTETLGDLLFQFFRRYGYELDFETVVVSVREAKLLSKAEKNWHLATNNRLCVEEPFSTNRNLGNTADDSAWRGLHLELRRAFDLIAEAKDVVSHVCQSYDFLEQPRPQRERPQPAPRPAVLTRSLSQSSRSGRGGGSFRGSRQQGRDAHRFAGANGRRASSAATFGHNPNQVYPSAQLGMPAELFSAPHQPHTPQQVQHISGLHDQFVQMQQSLYAREQELRQHAATIAQASASADGGGNTPSYGTPSRPPPLSNLPSLGSRTMEDNGPATAPLQPQYGYPYYRYNNSQLVFMYPASQPASNQTPGSTNTSSPLMTPTPLRRELQRNQYDPSSGAPVRSHSQPARPPIPQNQATNNSRTRPNGAVQLTSQDPRQGYPAVQNLAPSWVGPFVSPNGWVMAPGQSAQSRPREYLGYGFTGPTHVTGQYQAQNLTRATTYDDLRRHARQPSPRPRQTSMAGTMSRPSRSPSPLPEANGHYDGLRLAPSSNDPHAAFDSVNSVRPMGNNSPMIVNGSYFAGTRPIGLNENSETRPRRGSDSDTYAQPMFRSWSNVETSGTSGSINAHQNSHADERVFEASGITNGPQAAASAIGPEPESTETGSHASVSTPKSAQNGGSVPWLGTSTPTKSSMSNATDLSSPTDTQWGPAEDALATSISPDAGSRGGAGAARKSSGASKANIPPLDLGHGMPERPRDGAQSNTKILSPVQETRTPSPTASRRRESHDKPLSNITNGASAILMPKQFPQQSPSAPQAVKLPTSQGLPGNVPDPQSATSATPRSPLSSTTNTNPWQPAGKKGNKKNKGSQGHIDPIEAKSGGQRMPANVSERKGG